MFNKISNFITQYFPEIVLGISSVIFASTYFAISHFDTTRLSLFGPTATIYIEGIKKGLASGTLLLLFSFIIYTFFRKNLEKFSTILSNSFSSFSGKKKALIMFFVCLCAIFIFHAGNIIHGYFFLDDFEVVNVLQTHSLSNSMLIPHGDHPIPMHMLCIGLLYHFFNYNPLPYNIFVFLTFALISFFTYLIFQKEKISGWAFVIFLILYGGAANWAETLTGFYNISPYIQVVLFFTVMLWSYISWREEKKTHHLTIFAFATVSTVMSDISCVWTFPAIILYMLFTSPKKSEETISLHAKKIFSENKKPILILCAVGILYIIFLAVSFLWLNLVPFIYSVRVDSSLNVFRTVKVFFKIIPGLSMSLFMPHATKLLTHPSIVGKIQTLWPIFEALILLLNIFALRFFFKKAQTKERNLAFFVLSALFMTVMMVAIGRPGDGAVPDFYFQHIGMAFYFYCFMVALFADTALQTGNKNAAKIIFTLVVFSMASTQAFGFHAYRLKVEAEKRNEALTALNGTLLRDLKTISGETKNVPLSIPNLDGAHIHEPLGGVGLADYLLFFNTNLPINLIQNAQMFPDIKTGMVKTVSSLRASTSKEFLEALKEDNSLRTFYLSPALMSYSPGTTTLDSVQKMSKMINNNYVFNGIASPEQKHKIFLEFTTDDISGNTKIEFSFGNDFNLENSAGRIKIDDFMPYKISDGKRHYLIETDLLQLYAFALSEKIKDVTVTPSSEKGLIINNAFIR